MNLISGSDGILNRATSAVNTNEIEKAKEQTELFIADLMTEYYDEKYVVGNDVGTIADYIKTKIGDGTSIGEYYIKVVSGTTGKVVEMKQVASLENAYATVETRALKIEIYKCKTAEEATATNKLVEGTVGSNGKVDWIESTSQTAETYTAYNVGDTITIGTETFYVIEPSDENNAKVIAIAALNVDKTTNKQSSTGSDVRFDDDSAEYSGSEIEGLVNAYVAKLNEDNGTTATGSLMTLEQAEALGCDSSNYSTETAPDFINATAGMLLKTAVIDSDPEFPSVWVVVGRMKMLYPSTCSSMVPGFRPVIEISKSEI